MATTLYNPFLDFQFDNQTCFLTGRQLQSGDERIQVFPVWMMRAFDLEEKPFKMLDERTVTYKQLQLPCSADIASLFEQTEIKVEEAVQQGYEAVKNLDELVLFHWIAKILYGVVFNEIQTGIRQSVLSGEPMNFSQALVHKFRNLHAMLQSIVADIEFEKRKTFTIQIFTVANATENFTYRDKINTLIFSLHMRNFAIIATLQDNGTNAIYHEDVLKKIDGYRLHPIQFEEVCARYFYSAYLFNRLPEYTYMDTGKRVFVEPMPLNDWTLKPIFDPWQAKTYGQVLENFWKPWGYTLFEIIKDPEHPMTFLADEEGGFRAHVDVPLLG